MLLRSGIGVHHTREHLPHTTYGPDLPKHFMHSCPDGPTRMCDWALSIAVSKDPAAGIGLRLAARADPQFVVLNSTLGKSLMSGHKVTPKSD
jgi:hypothetical protein